MKRLLFIYNPHAGKELLKPKLSDIIDIFVKAGYEVVAYPTQSYRDAYRKVSEYDSDEYDLVVCSGGDGTIDEVVTGMMQRDKRDPIGYIPTGTTNDFANSLHIPKGLLRAADNAVNGTLFPCDVGKFNGDEECAGASGVCAGGNKASVQCAVLPDQGDPRWRDAGR